MDESAAHQEIAREITHEGELRRDYEVRPEGFGPSGAVDDERGIAGDIARRGIGLKQRNAQKGPSLRFSLAKWGPSSVGHWR